MLTKAVKLWPNKSSEKKAFALKAVKDAHALKPPTARVPLWALSFDKPPIPHTWPSEDLVPAGADKLHPLPPRTSKTRKQEQQ